MYGTATKFFFSFLLVLLHNTRLRTAGLPSVAGPHSVYGNAGRCEIIFFFFFFNRKTTAPRDCVGLPSVTGRSGAGAACPAEMIFFFHNTRPRTAGLRYTESSPVTRPSEQRAEMNNFFFPQHPTADPGATDGNNFFSLPRGAGHGASETRRPARRVAKI